jgi:signal transduction histidine kinase
MSGTFIVLAGIKAFFFLPAPDRSSLDAATQWLMQIINVVIIGVMVQWATRFIDQLHARHTELQISHEELMSREEEISRQNSELQSQTEELAAQNEELERQAEELQEQSEELQTQSEELQTTNRELEKRQALLHTLLESVRVTGGDRELLERVCSSLFDLLDGAAAAACVLELENDALVLRAHCGPLVRAADRWPFEQSFAAIVMAEQRTGFIADLAKRPDLVLPRSESRDFRSVMATPLRVRGVPAGVVMVFSFEPREWTKEDFRMIEWVSAQSTLILEVRQLHRELRATNLNLDRVVGERTRELQDTVNELEHFSYTITHDMRAPLRAMTGYADMLAERSGAWLDPECREFVRRITSSATRMDRLITDALAYGQALRQNLHLTPVDAEVLLREIIESYPSFQPPKATIEIHPQIPPVIANPAGLTQCFSNLLHNAVKFVPDGVVPKVRIRGERNDGMVRLWFEDNGIGISPEMHAKLFVMFQRLNKRYEGTGIGLALVKKVAERMGGRVGLESAPGRGSRFWVELKSSE